MHVNSKASASYDWLRQIPKSLLELDQVPLFGFTPPFPWDDLSESLARTFELSSLKIKPTQHQWLTKDKLYDVLPDSLIPLNFSIAGIEGTICWVLPKKDILNLSAKILHSEIGKIISAGPDLEESFYRFLAFKITQTINDLDWDKSLSIHTLNRKELPQEDSFCIDIEASIENITVNGRLILSPTFQKSFKRRYDNRSLDRPELKTALAEKLEATIHLEVGHTTLKLDEWKNAKRGDLLLLDGCSINT